MEIWKNEIKFHSLKIPPSSLKTLSCEPIKMQMTSSSTNQKTLPGSLKTLSCEPAFNDNGIPSEDRHHQESRIHSSNQTSYEIIQSKHIKRGNLPIISRRQSDCRLLHHQKIIRCCRKDKKAKFEKFRKWFSSLTLKDKLTLAINLRLDIEMFQLDMKQGNQSRAT